MPRSANYCYVPEESNAEQLVIRDLGPWNAFKTVTNAVEEVVADLYRAGVLWAGRRLLYYDSLEELTEIAHAGGRFEGFRPVGK